MTLIRTMQLEAEVERLRAEVERLLILLESKPT